MAARLNPRHSEMVREKIRAGLLIKKLEDHVLEDTELSATQVSAALGLLKKIIPDLARSENNSTVEHKGLVVVNVGFDAPRHGS